MILIILINYRALLCSWIRVYQLSNRLYSSRETSRTGGKTPACQCKRHRDAGSTPGSGRSPAVGNGNLIQYSCLENSVDRGAWWATGHGAAKNGTWLSNWAHRKQKHPARSTQRKNSSPIVSGSKDMENKTYISTRN